MHSQYWSKLIQIDLNFSKLFKTYQILLKIYKNMSNLSTYLPIHFHPCNVNHFPGFRKAKKASKSLDNFKQIWPFCIIIIWRYYFSIFRCPCSFGREVTRTPQSRNDSVIIKLTQPPHSNIRCHYDISRLR